MLATEPFLLDLSFRGFIEGKTRLNYKTQKPQCHYFGGLPYALPPVGPYRWRQARPLPACYRYGTRANPGRFTGGAALCPQPGFDTDPDQTLWDEDCLQLNVWMPTGEIPDKGWPVLFYIHGGFLQIGNPNDMDVAALLDETECHCIVVCPAYRLNLFGFLASQELENEAKLHKEPLGNFGFWDQRLALEWTYKNISYFGGNPSEITVAGLSAGAHSAFHQLSHDIYLPPPFRIIRRVLMLSNGSGMQPKSLSASQNQFDDLTSALSIPSGLSSSEKLARLRSLPTSALIAASRKIPTHQFRAWSDGVFVRKALFADIDSGVYAQKLKEACVHLIIGEVQLEHYLYSAWRPPATQSMQALHDRFCAEYPDSVVSALLQHYCPDGNLPTGTWPTCKAWSPDAFGRIYADLQVHSLIRGYVDGLIKGGAVDLVHRYRIDFRAKCVDNVVPPEWGATHSTDLALWFWGNGDRDGLTGGEKDVVRKFLGPVWGFLNGRGGWETSWGADAAKGEVRLLRSDGSVGVWEDDDMERALGVWGVIREVQKREEQDEGEEGSTDAKL